MVSAAKYARDLKQPLSYGERAKQFYDRADVVLPEAGRKFVSIAVTSDRGE